VKRHCDTCGKPYFRRNLFVAWVQRNPGHRDGWHRREVRQCLTCQPLTMTLNLLRVAHIKPRKGANDHGK